MNLRRLIAPLRVFKRLAAAEAASATEHTERLRGNVIILDAFTKAAADARRLAAIVNAHFTCYRCGAMHHNNVSQRMKSPAGREVHTCVWCVTLLSQRGFEVVKTEEVIEA